MKKVLIAFFLCLSLISKGQDNFRIAFGSCSRQYLPEQLWSEIVSQKPDIWVWGGDNIYGDTHNMTILAAEYEKQKQSAGYQQLLQTCPITGTWDDHDYGVNDGGRFFSMKKESKVLAADFLGFDKKHPVWEHEGLYNSTSLKKGQHTIHIINLDTRYFRDTIRKVYFVDSLTKRRAYRYEPNLEGDMLGEEQWSWLEQQLKNTEASLFIINSSVQLISEEHRFERWAALPKAQQRFYALLKRYPTKRVIIISGDRHIAELSKRNFSDLPYPLYDFTASGLSHTWSENWKEENAYRIGSLIIQKNFGVMDIRLSENTIDVSFRVIGKDGIVYAEHYDKF